MSGSGSKIWALYPLSVLAFWTLGAINAEDSKDQALFREVDTAVKKKEWPKATAALDRWLARKTELYGAQAKEAAAAYRDAGHVYAIVAQHEKAIEAFQREITILKAGPEVRSQELGLLLVDLAESQKAQGQGSEAIVSFREALAIFEADPGPEAAVTATCLNKLSLLLLYRGLFDQAEPLMRRALKIREKLYSGQSHLDLVASLGNLGLLYFQLGAYEEAEEPLRRALEILDGLASKEAACLLSASKVRHTLASVYAAQGKFDEAEDLLQRTVHDVMKEFGNDSIETAEAMATLGKFDLNGKRFKQAEESFTKVLRIQSRKLPASHDEILRTRNSLAACYQYQGNYPRAREIFEETLGVCEEKLGKDHSLTIAVTNNLGMSLVMLGDKPQAQQHARKFLQLLSANVENVLSYFPENRRLSFFGNMGFSPYDLAATLGDGPLTADAVLTFKAAVLQSVARDRRRALLSGDSDDVGLLGEINELREQFLEAQLAGRTQRTRDLAATLEEKEKEISFRLKEDKTYRPLQRVHWKDVASRLPVDAVLLEFFFYKKHLGGKGGWRDWCGAVALAREREPVFRELGPSDELLKSIAAYLDIAAGERFAVPSYTSSVATSNSTENSRQGETYQRNTEMEEASGPNAETGKVCHDLFKKLISPFVDMLPPDGGQLLICPDGRLSFVSFATLLDDHDQFLGSRFQVSYVDSGRIFLQPSQLQKKSDSIVLLGNPDFASLHHRQNALAASQMVRNLNENITPMKMSKGPSRLTTVRFDPLPGTADEVQMIEAVFQENGWKAQSLQGGEATEINLRAAAPAANIVHLATHGYFMSEFEVGPEARISNPMLRSWLALAGAKATLRRWENGGENGGAISPANDGILMAAEVASLDLSAAELVVLSACDTVRGEPRNGEGILGLRRGVALAGAKNLLLTCWRIQDRYTAEFMKLLYASILSGVSPAQALHNAQASELKRLREEKGTFAAVHLAGPFIITALNN